jgi:hypothetical protein
MLPGTDSYCKKIQILTLKPCDSGSALTVRPSAAKPQTLATTPTILKRDLGTFSISKDSAEGLPLALQNRLQQ